MIHIFDDYYIEANMSLYDYNVWKKTDSNYEFLGCAETFTEALDKLRERAFLREINNNDYELNTALLIYSNIDRKIYDARGL